MCERYPQLRAVPRKLFFCARVVVVEQLLPIVRCDLVWGSGDFGHVCAHVGPWRAGLATCVDRVRPAWERLRRSTDFRRLAGFAQHGPKFRRQDRSTRGSRENVNIVCTCCFRSRQVHGRRLNTVIDSPGSYQEQMPASLANRLTIVRMDVRCGCLIGRTFAKHVAEMPRSV